ncbi:glucosamine 6-phosphate N-acetyltransferase-like [Tubulanus polymorphus]|uniref:glucosamine 6-phosphate N-acetyltransferase-like n=1 Tax=Tubulanus polymorphus TaxID=672921 RepID=UPI003DA453AB
MQQDQQHDKCVDGENGVTNNTNGHRVAVIEDIEYLFDPKFLQDINFELECSASYNPVISIHNPGESLTMRPLSNCDYEKGFIELLGHLTVVGNITRDLYLEKFHAMKACPGTYYVAVLEDTDLQQIIGSATLVIEHKFIRGTVVRGRIEDVVTLDSHRGMQLGKLLVDALTILSKHLGCYKTTLECKDDKMPFYNKFGYVKSLGNNYMECRFNEPHST